jgi:hypothetical protein
MIVRAPIGGFGIILLHPALGFGGRPESPIEMTSARASRPIDESVVLASICPALPPEPPVLPPAPADPPEPLVALLEPPGPDVLGPDPLDVVCVVPDDPPLPPDDPFVPVVRVVPDVVSDTESEHALATANERAKRIGTTVLNMATPDDRARIVIAVMADSTEVGGPKKHRHRNSTKF